MSEQTARDVVAMLQHGVDTAIAEHDPAPVLACFTDDPVLVGTSRYNRGAEAAHVYLQALATGTTTLRWHLGRCDVFLDTDDLIGFGAEGEVEWADDDGAGRDPFRLTIVAERSGDRWRVRHFHGSLPES
jgi:uncharacterized protein (TIGR02246 family)